MFRIALDFSVEENWTFSCLTPEYEKLFSSVFVTSSRARLQESVSAQEFAEFELQELSDLLAKTSRGRFGAEKAMQIQAQARQSIGVGFLANAVQVEMRCLWPRFRSVSFLSPTYGPISLYGISLSIVSQIAPTFLCHF